MGILAFPVVHGFSCQLAQQGDCRQDCQGSHMARKKFTLGDKKAGEQQPVVWNQMAIFHVAPFDASTFKKRIVLSIGT